MSTVVEVAADECDACDSAAHVQAYAYIRMPSGRSLSMCGHHWHEHADALTEQGATCVDMTHLLHPDPA